MIANPQKEIVDVNLHLFVTAMYLEPCETVTARSR